MTMRATLVVLALLLVPTSAHAQDEGYVLYQLGPAAQQIQDEGLDGSPESIPRMIEILQSWGVNEAYDVSVEEAREVVRDSRERREFVRGVAFQMISCQVAQQKAAAAGKLGRALRNIALVNTIGAGIAVGTGAGAILAAPLGFAALVTGAASTWANDLSSMYKSAQCIQGDLWKSRTPVIHAKLAPPCLTHDSGTGSFGRQRG